MIFPPPTLVGQTRIIAHDEDLWLFILVAVIALVGTIALLRITLGGARSPGKAALPPKSYKRVLLAAAGGYVAEGGGLPGFSEEAVELACRLAGSAAGGASVLLTYVIEVPRALAPNAVMPAEEAEASRALGAGAESVKKWGLPVGTQIRKGRAAVEETLRTLKEEQADLLVLMIPPGPGDANMSQPLLAFTTELARRAPCEIILARAAAA